MSQITYCDTKPIPNRLTISDHHCCVNFDENPMVILTHLSSASGFVKTNLDLNLKDIQIQSCRLPPLFRRKWPLIPLLLEHYCTPIGDYHCCLRLAFISTRAVAIHDSLNRESIQNPNFQVNRESKIRQNLRILLLKESRIGLKSLLFSES